MSKQLEAEPFGEGSQSVVSVNSSPPPSSPQAVCSDSNTIPHSPTIGRPRSTSPSAKKKPERPSGFLGSTALDHRTEKRVMPTLQHTKRSAASMMKGLAGKRQKLWNTQLREKCMEAIPRSGHTQRLETSSKKHRAHLACHHHPHPHQCRVLVLALGKSRVATSAISHTFSIHLVRTRRRQPKAEVRREGDPRQKSRTLPIQRSLTNSVIAARMEAKHI